MTDVLSPQREEEGWIVAVAGPSLQVLFHPDHPMPRGSSKFQRPTIIVMISGHSGDVLLFEAWEGDRNCFQLSPPIGKRVYLSFREGQSRLDAALAYFEDPVRLRTLLELAAPGRSGNISDQDIMAVPARIRQLLV